MTEELMLGNWVRISGEFVQIKSICDSNINFYWDTYDSICWTHSDSIEAIPLTQGILEKCGFTKRSDEYWNFWILPNKWYISEALHSEPSAGVEEGKFYYGDDYTEVKSLHHLMNLYYVLVGKKLEFEL